MHIRRITEADIPVVVSLIARTLRVVNSRDYPTEYIEDLVSRNGPANIARRSKTAHMYVVCAGERIVGCGAIRRLDASADACTLLSVFVLPELHGQGIGRRIVQALEVDEYARRARRIELHASLTAVDFYLKLGYTYKNGVRKISTDGCVLLEKRRDDMKHF